VWAWRVQDTDSTLKHSQSIRFFGSLSSYGRDKASRRTFGTSSAYNPNLYLPAFSMSRHPTCALAPLTHVLSAKSGRQQILPFDRSDAERSSTISNVANYLNRPAPHRPQASQVNKTPLPNELPGLYFTQGVLKEPKLAKEAARSLLPIRWFYALGCIASMASVATQNCNGAARPTCGTSEWKTNLQQISLQRDKLLGPNDKLHISRRANNFPDSALEWDLR
jgi:hypothetical protein